MPAHAASGQTSPSEFTDATCDSPAPRTKASRAVREPPPDHSIRRLLDKNIALNGNALRLPTAQWDNECPQHSSGFLFLKSAVNSAYWELLVTSCILADFIVTVMSLDSEEELPFGVFLMVIVCLLVLLLDVLLRMLKDGRKFFILPLNWIELVVAFISMILLSFEIVARVCQGGCGGSSKTAKSIVLGRSFRPVLKIARVVRVATRALSGKAAVQAKMDKFLLLMMIRRLECLLSMPPSNIIFRPSIGLLHVEKAHIRSTAFEGIHLPLTVSCGIVDMVHVHVKLRGQQSITKKTNHTFQNIGFVQRLRRWVFGSDKCDAAVSSSEFDPVEQNRIIVVIENVLLVLGPGHHQEAPAPRWDFDQVMEAKEQLVDRLWNIVQGKARKTPNGQAFSFLRHLKKGLLKRAETMLSGGMHVAIRNIEVRFEDGFSDRAPYSVCPCTTGATIVAGVRIGHIDCRARAVRPGSLQDAERLRVTGTWDFQIPMTASVQDSSSKVSARQSRSSPRKHQKHHSLGANFTMNEFAVFWDRYTAGDKRINSLDRYTEALQQKAAGNIDAFLRLHVRKQQSERMALQLCLEVERRISQAQSRRRVLLAELWHRRQWSPPLFDVQAAAFPSSADVVEPGARAKVQRLRDRVTMHRYVVLPFDVSAHCLVTPSQACGAAPNIDVDVLVPSLTTMLDVSQAASVVRLLGYFKRWQADDLRFQWMPPPAHRGGASATNRWWFALREVLVGLDPNRQWQCLAFVDSRRTYRQKARVIHLLEQNMVRSHHRDLISILQVGLTPAAIIGCRKKVAESLMDELRLRREQHLHNRCCRLLLICWSAEDEIEEELIEPDEQIEADFDDTGLDENEVNGEDDDTGVERLKTQGTLLVKSTVTTQSSATARSFPGASSGKAIKPRTVVLTDAQKFAALLTKVGNRHALQLRVQMTRVTAFLLCSPADESDRGVRRALVRAEVVGVALIALLAAPPEVWGQVAPITAVHDVVTGATSICDPSPGAVKITIEESADRGLTSPVAQLVMHEARAVFCAAPLSSPWLRRLCHGGGRARKVAAFPAICGFVKTERRRPWFDEAGGAQEPSALLRLRFALLGQAGSPATSHLHVDAVALPLEVRLCKPMMAALRGAFQPLPSVFQRTPTPRWGSKSSSSEWSTLLKRNESSRLQRGLSRVIEWCGNPALKVGQLAAERVSTPTTPMSASPERSSFGLDSLFKWPLHDVRGRDRAEPERVEDMIAVQPVTPEELIGEDPEIIKARAKWQERRNQQHLDERIMGCGGPLDGMVITARFLLLGDALATLLEPYSERCWSLKRVGVQPGIVHWWKPTSDLGVQVRFQPIASSGGTPVQVSGGWWYESSEMHKTNERLIRMCCREKVQGVEAFDVSCVGVDGKDRMKSPDLDKDFWDPDGQLEARSTTPLLRLKQSARGLSSPPAVPFPVRRQAEGFSKSLGIIMAGCCGATGGDLEAAFALTGVPPGCDLTVASKCFLEPLVAFPPPRPPVVPPPPPAPGEPPWLDGVGEPLVAHLWPPERGRGRQPSQEPTAPNGPGTPPQPALFESAAPDAGANHETLSSPGALGGHVGGWGDQGGGEEESGDFEIQLQVLPSVQLGLPAPSIAADVFKGVMLGRVS